MAGQLMKVHPAFQAFAKNAAREWTVKSGRNVSAVSVTEAMARAFEAKGALHVSIICPPNQRGRPTLKNPFEF